MRLLASTTQTQGYRKNDFCFVPENELVILPCFECYGEKVDGRCGCRRSMSGIKCRKSTTTFKVINTRRKKQKLIVELTKFFRRHWMPDDVVAKRIAISALNAVIHVANKFPLNTVLERRGKRFFQRKQ